MRGSALVASRDSVRRIDTCTRHGKPTQRRKTWRKNQGVRLCSAVGHIHRGIIGLDTAGWAPALGAELPLLQRRTDVNGTVRSRGAMLVAAAERAGFVAVHWHVLGDSEGAEDAEGREDARAVHVLGV